MLRTFALCAALLSIVPGAHAADCKPAPLGDATLYLRGGLNNWSAPDEHAFEYRCNAYFLNLKASGTQEFKLADEDWSPGLTFGGDGQGEPSRSATGNLKREFRGAWPSPPTAAPAWPSAPRPSSPRRPGPSPTARS
jgi:hypothetical protein